METILTQKKIATIFVSIQTYRIKPWYFVNLVRYNIHHCWEPISSHSSITSELKKEMSLLPRAKDFESCLTCIDEDALRYDKRLQIFCLQAKFFKIVLGRDLKSGLQL